MTMKKDAVGNNPLSHLIPRGPAPRPAAPAAPQAPAAGPTPAPVAPEPLAAPVAASAPPALSVPVAAVAPAASAAPVAHVTPPSAVASAPPLPATTNPDAGAGAGGDDEDHAPGGTGATPLKRCTVRLPVALLERMTSAIVHTPGMTQADFVADALVAHLAVLEAARGSAFPAYGKRLRPGRKSW